LGLIKKKEEKGDAHAPHSQGAALGWHMAARWAAKEKSKKRTIMP
jgi:hypothetical protein